MHHHRRHQTRVMGILSGHAVMRYQSLPFILELQVGQEIEKPLQCAYFCCRLFCVVSQAIGGDRARSYGPEFDQILLRNVQDLVGRTLRAQGSRGHRRARMMWLREANQNVGIDKNRHLEAARAVDGFPVKGFVWEQGCCCGVALAPGRKFTRPFFGGMRMGA